MSKFLGTIFKASLFASFVLVLGAWVQYEGRSISDHVETHVRKAKRWEVTQKMTHWSSGILKDNAAQEDIESSERQKLRRLISDLNH